MQIQFVTSNEGKFREVAEALARKGFELQWKKQTYPELQVSTLEEVVDAGLKWLRERLGPDTHFMLDDSGLFIPALKDFPGVYSAYVYKTVGNDGMLRLMEGQKDREARFECMIGFYSPSSGFRKFKGVCEGSIGTKPAGKEGFGFDPIFIPKGEKRTFAEIGIEEKNSFSHRGKAVEELLKYLEKL